MSVIIDVPSLRASLEGEAVQFENFQASLSRVKDDLQRVGNNNSLSGSGYIAMKRYYLGISSPLIDEINRAVEAKKNANRTCISNLDAKLGGEGVIDVQKLTDAYNDLFLLRNRLENISDSIEALTSWIPFLGIVITGSLSLIISTVYEAERLLRQKLENVWDFMSSTEGLYDEASSVLATSVNLGLSAAEGAFCGISQTSGGGATIPYYLNVPVIRQWAAEVKQVEKFFSNCPEYALEVFDDPELSRTASGGTVGVATWNYPGQLSCTFYTLRKLRERGLGYPFVQAGTNGGSWYGNCDSCVPGSEGENCVADLFGQYGEMNNVVVSFSGPSPWGHVLLIDKVYQGDDGQLHVVWSDNYPDITSEDGSNPAKDMTYAEFLNWYKNIAGNGAPIGARYIGGEC